MIPTALMTAAVKMAEAGIAVFPLVPRDKIPLTANGCKDVSSDADQVTAWWEKWPPANIGVATGSPNRLVVVDVDGDVGRASLMAVESAHGRLPQTLQQATPRGRHFLFSYDGDDVRNSAGKLGKGIDVRGEGGYIVISPSVHPSGTVYEWVKPFQRIADLPAWLHKLLTAPPVVKAPVPMTPAVIRRTADASHGALRRRASAYCAAAEGAGEGRRNDSVFRLAGNLAAFVGEGGEALAEGEILELMRDFNSRCVPPLPDDELLKAVANGLKNGESRPPKPPRHPQHRAIRLRGREVRSAN